jgi:hypothetical protein
VSAIAVTVRPRSPCAAQQTDVYILDLESIAETNTVHRMNGSITRFSAMSLMVVCSCKPAQEGDPDGARGVAIQRNVTERGVVDEPRDLSAARFSSGGRTTAGALNGTFDLVPGDWLEVRLGNERIFLPADSATPDLGYYHFGRSDVWFPSSKTDIAFQISGLESWSNGDSLQIVSPNAGMTMAGPESLFAAYPAAGTTAIAGARLD